MVTLGGNSLGTKVNDLLGQLGLQGGAFGAQIDALAGNPVGMLRNLSDAFHEAATGRGTTGLQRLRNERAFGAFGLSARPQFAMARLRPFLGRTYHRMDLAPGVGTRGLAMFHPKRRAAMKFERLLSKNPRIRAAFEKAIGGKFIPDGRTDGKLTIRRPLRGPVPFPGLPPHLNSLGSHIRGMQNAIVKLAQDLKIAQNGSAPRGGQSSPASSATNAASFEDLLFGIMMDQMKKLQREIEGKGKELKALQNKDKKPGKGKGGFLKGLGKLAGGAVGGPLGTMAGQTIGGLLGGAGQSGASSGAGSKKSEEEITKELEQLTKKYERFLTSVDNIMSLLHKTSMSSIRKIGQ